MKIAIVHGEHTELARKRFSTIIDKVRSRGSEIVEVDLEVALGEQIVGRSLFGSESLFVVEEVRKLSKKDVEWLVENIEGLEGNLLAYGKGTVAASLLRPFGKKAKIEKFDIPKLVFKFLGMIYPGNSGEVIRVLHDIVRHEAVEFVFAMMASLLRDLYWVRVSPSSIPYPSWRVARLESQAGKFEDGQIERIIGRLADIDMKVKTSSANLLQELDLLIISELE